MLFLIISTEQTTAQPLVSFGLINYGKHIKLENKFSVQLCIPFPACILSKICHV